MNTLIFKGIRHVNDARNVAVFEEFNREFLLDQESLEVRIANLSRTYDVSVELYALKALRQRNFTDKLSTTFSSPAQ